MLLNPDMTEKKATEKAKFNADGNLIWWDLSNCPITALPECECN